MNINLAEKRLTHWALLLLTLVSLGLNQTTAVAEDSIPIAATTDYLLRPADVLQVKIHLEDDLTREVSVSQEYTISLPLIGTVDVRSKSARQVEEVVRQLYDKDFLVNPQVTLIVLRYAERSVNVIGSVNAPQAVPFPPERGLTLLEAIARAGGFSRLAKRSQVTITRTDDKGVSTTFTVNAERLIEGQSPNLWQLQVNDLINVPENFL
jgi:polysaccharide export outer membrane protein